MATYSEDAVKSSNLKVDAPCFESKSQFFTNSSLINGLKSNQTAVDSKSNEEKRDANFQKSSASSSKGSQSKGYYNNNRNSYNNHHGFNNSQHKNFPANNNNISVVKDVPTGNRNDVRWGHQDNSTSNENGGVTANIKNQNNRFPPRFNKSNTYAVNRNKYSAESNSRPSNSTNWRSKPNLESVPRDKNNLNVIDQDHFDSVNVKIVTSNNNVNDNIDSTFEKSSSSAASKGTTDNRKNYPTKREYINGNVKNNRNNFHFNSQQSRSQNKNKITNQSNNTYNNNHLKDENTSNFNFHNPDLTAVDVANLTNEVATNLDANQTQNNFGARPKQYKGGDNNNNRKNSNNLNGNNYNNKSNNGIKRDNINSGKNNSNNIKSLPKKVIANENWDVLDENFINVDDNNHCKSNKKDDDEEDDDDGDLESSNIVKRPNDESQRGLLEQQLTNATYECMVCCFAIKKDIAIWHCSICFHIYHLYCIKKWANTSCGNISSSSNNNSNDIVSGKNENDGKAWRCPACQNLNLVLPDRNYCFCGKMVDPPYSGYFTPHSCGDMCGKKRNANCKHPCNVPCHPGPCPPCTAMVNVACDCGKMQVNVKCSTAQNIKCQDACDRVLNCGQHQCSQWCHRPPCHSCQVKVERSCHCGQLNKQVLCGSSEYFISSYSCGQQCNKLLNCGNHKCLAVCHDGPCDTCKLVPSLVTHCPCGKTQLGDIKCESGDFQGKRSQKKSNKNKDNNNDDKDDGDNNNDNSNNVRTSCLDPVPCCWKKCNKELECGDAGSFHRCKSTCHTGACPDCAESMSVVCRCQASSKLLTCKEFVSLKRRSLPVKCDNRCGSKMSCGRHRCSQNCCLDDKHVCNVICAHKLTCGLHKCEEVCHKGRCPTCWRASFDELTCECGLEVIYPPVPCGTAPPICVRPCTRVHPCTHPVQHKCHSEPLCPPCAILMQKLCMCGRETRANVPCFLQDVSCGRPCGKPLPCRVHNCVQLCHKAPCLDGGKMKCTQPCPAARRACGHPCMAPCHVGQPCPPTKCKAQVLVRCECGRREEKMICLTDQKLETKDDYSRAAANIVASQLWNSQSIDLAILKDVKNKNRLPCNDMCGIQKRNKALADALNIENANITNELPGLMFNEFLRDFSKQNLKFVTEVEDVFIKIIKEAEKSKVGRKMHSFKVMPSNKRRLIHELAECYSIESESVDEEPNRSVVVTATKNVSHLLTKSLTSLTKQGTVPRPPPIPIPANYDEDKLKSQAQASKQASNAKTNGDDGEDGEWRTIGSKHKKADPVIDYFDFSS